MKMETSQSAFVLDKINFMIPLHMLAINPHAPTDVILALLKANTNAANLRAMGRMTPVDCALKYNPCDFVTIYDYFCGHSIENELPLLLEGYDNYDCFGFNFSNSKDNGKNHLHALVMNYFAPADAIATLLNLKMENVFCLDNTGKTPLDYAREYNVEGLISMIVVLFNRRNSTVSMENHTVGNSKKREIEDCHRYLYTHDMNMM